MSEQPDVLARVRELNNNGSTTPTINTDYKLSVA